MVDVSSGAGNEVSVGVVIPHVPVSAREATLQRAVRSVQQQTHTVQELYVCPDSNHDGPGATRTRGLLTVQSEWVIYLDDDDWLHPNFVERTLAHAEETGADLVYPWFQVNNGADPFPMFFDRPWDNADPHIFPITYLVRTALAREAGGFPSADEMGERWAAQWNGYQGGEDWAAILNLIDLGAKIEHLPERLWTWDHGGHHHYSGSTW